MSVLDSESQRSLMHVFYPIAPPTHTHTIDGKLELVKTEQPKRKSML